VAAAHARTGAAAGPEASRRPAPPQALLFLERGSVLVAPKPWQQGAAPALVSRADQLPAEVRQHVEQLAAGGGGRSPAA
jgi:hypothetical protein